MYPNRLDFSDTGRIRGREVIFYLVLGRRGEQTVAARGMLIRFG